MEKTNSFIDGKQVYVAPMANEIEIQFRQIICQSPTETEPEEPF